MKVLVRYAMVAALSVAPWATTVEIRAQDASIAATTTPSVETLFADAAAKETAKENATAGVTTDAARGVKFEVLIDGKPASLIDTWSHRGVVKTDAAGKKYRAAYNASLEAIREKGDVELSRRVWDGTDFAGMKDEFRAWAAGW